MAFGAGHIPWNAGLAGKGICIRTSGCFKKGQIAPRRMAIGSEIVRKQQNLIYVKIANPTKKNAKSIWKLKHHFIWEKKRGQIPKNSVLIFKDGNKRNFKIGNLLLLSRKKYARLNHWSNYPKAIKEVIAMQGLLTKQINKNERQTKKRPN